MWPVGKRDGALSARCRSRKYRTRMPPIFSPGTNALLRTALRTYFVVKREGCWTKGCRSAPHWLLLKMRDEMVDWGLGKIRDQTSTKRSYDETGERVQLLRRRSDRRYHPAAVRHRKRLALAAVGLHPEFTIEATFTRLQREYTNRMNGTEPKPSENLLKSYGEGQPLPRFSALIIIQSAFWQQSLGAEDM